MENLIHFEELAAALAYQEDAVVSKTLVKKPTGSVTLFAFDRDQELSEHSAPYDAMVTIVDGAADITLDGESFHLKKDGMLIMPANVPHALKAPERFKMMLVMIRDEE